MSNKLLLNSTNADIINEINKLKNSGIGGSAENAVLYTPQELTEEQKKQVLINLGLANLPLQIGDPITGILYLDTSLDLDEMLASLTYDLQGQPMAQLYGARIIGTINNNPVDIETPTILAIRNDLGDGTYCYAIVDYIAANQQNFAGGIVYISHNTPSEALAQYGATKTGWQIDEYDAMGRLALLGITVTSCITTAVPEIAFAYSKPLDSFGNSDEKVVTLERPEEKTKITIEADIFNQIKDCDTIILTRNYEGIPTRQKFHRYESSSVSVNGNVLEQIKFLSGLSGVILPAYLNYDTIINNSNFGAEYLLVSKTNIGMDETIDMDYSIYLYPINEKEIDDHLEPGSENPVQNSVVTQEFHKCGKLDGVNNWLNINYFKGILQIENPEDANKYVQFLGNQVSVNSIFANVSPNILTFPEKSGTFATTDDINNIDFSSYGNLNYSNTWKGANNFDSSVEFRSTTAPLSHYGFNATNGTTISQSTKYEYGKITNGSYTLTLPDKTGTLATIDDIPTSGGSDLLTSNNTWSGTNTFNGKTFTANCGNNITDMGSINLSSWKINLTASSGLSISGDVEATSNKITAKTFLSGTSMFGTEITSQTIKQTHASASYTISPDTSITSGTYALKLPAKSGTLATLEDIPASGGGSSGGTVDAYTKEEVDEKVKPLATSIKFTTPDGRTLTHKAVDGVIPISGDTLRQSMGVASATNHGFMSIAQATKLANAVISSEQELTDGQKKQSQANIGLAEKEALQVGDLIDVPLLLDTSLNLDSFLSGLTYTYNMAVLYAADVEFISNVGILTQNNPTILAIRNDLGNGTYCYGIVDAIAANQQNFAGGTAYISHNTPSAILAQFGASKTGWQMDVYDTTARMSLTGVTYLSIKTTNIPSINFAYKVTPVYKKREKTIRLPMPEEFAEIELSEETYEEYKNAEKIILTKTIGEEENTHFYEFIFHKDVSAPEQNDVGAAFFSCFDLVSSTDIKLYFLRVQNYHTSMGGGYGMILHSITLATK